MTPFHYHPIWNKRYPYKKKSSYQSWCSISWYMPGQVLKCLGEDHLGGMPSYVPHHSTVTLLSLSLPAQHSYLPFPSSLPGSDVQMAPSFCRTTPATLLHRFDALLLPEIGFPSPPSPLPSVAGVPCPSCPFDATGATARLFAESCSETLHGVSLRFSGPLSRHRQTCNSGITTGERQKHPQSLRQQQTPPLSLATPPQRWLKPVTPQQHNTHLRNRTLPVLPRFDSPATLPPPPSPVLFWHFPSSSSCFVSSWFESSFSVTSTLPPAAAGSCRMKYVQVPARISIHSKMQPKPEDKVTRKSKCRLVKFLSSSAQS